MDKFKDECGVFGIFGHPEAANMTYLGLYALQHRGQESAGIAASDGQQVRVSREMGYVADVFDSTALSHLPGSLAIGHVRYSTAGESKLSNAQPILIDCTHGQIAVCHNGNLVNARELRDELVRQGSIFQSGSDTEVILHLYARSKAQNVEDAIIESVSQVQGAFSLTMCTRDRLIAVRDPHGFRPLALGRLNLGEGAPGEDRGEGAPGEDRGEGAPGGDRGEGAPGEDNVAWVVCSETCAMDLIGATYVRDIEPGEVLIISADGVRSRKPFPPAPLAHCIFEHVYFARPDSYVFGKSVNEVRTDLGRILAREQPVDGDVVVPVPDSGVCAAMGYADESGVPLRMGLIRNHYVGRTFIQPQQSIRHFGVKVKLNPVRSILEGKRVILVDDSIVRGTTSRKIVRMVRAAGASEVHVRISCPPTISPCFYGVDTPRKSELIAATHTLEEIRDFLEADSVGYLSLEGLLTAVGSDRRSYCSSCYTGIYPVEFPRDEATYLQLALKLDNKENKEPVAK
jgi:amidophosphoribosyltransferase